MTAASIGTSASGQSRRAVTAAVIGNVLEWYDFAVYGYVAAIIGKNFFPGTDETTELLKAFLTFGLGFVARPIGGIVIGRMGDTHGRKAALMLTIFLMALGTVLIGILPTYASIGVAAPALLLFARLMQGFSTGGEWGGSTAYIVEWAPRDKRGLFGSFQQMSVVAGLLLGSSFAALLNTLLTPAEMADWGWRVPFLVGGILGPIGLYMRRTIDETPHYERAKAAPPPASSESGFLLAARAFGFTIVWTVCFYVLLTYMPSWTAKYMSLTPAAALWSNSIGLVALIIGIPIMGALSDRYGRRPLLLICCAAYGFSVGNIITLPSLIMQREFPPGSFSLVLGLSTAIGTFAGALGPGLIGLIREAAGDYGAALLVCMALKIVGGAFVLVRKR